MKTLLQSADEYLKLSGWKDLALIKFCLFAMGVLVGTYAKRDAKKEVRAVAAAVFVLSYIPLMFKYILVLIKTVNDRKVSDIKEKILWLKWKAHILQVAASGALPQPLRKLPVLPLL